MCNPRERKATPLVMAAKNKTISAICVNLAKWIARAAAATKNAKRTSASGIGCPGFLSGLNASRRGLTTERPNAGSREPAPGLTTEHRSRRNAQLLLTPLSHVEPSTLLLLLLSRLQLNPLSGSRAAQRPHVITSNRDLRSAPF